MAKNHYLVMEGDAADSSEAIMLCANALEKQGLVGHDFGPKCIEREKEYPTGLPTEIPVAIPHCKDEETKGNSICFLKLGRPVTFRRMDDDRESIETRCIFNLAIADATEHLGVLQNLMGFLGDAQKLKQCMSLSDKELIAYLEKNIG